MCNASGCWVVLHRSRHARSRCFLLHWGNEASETAAPFTRTTQGGKPSQDPLECADQGTAGPVLSSSGSLGLTAFTSTPQTKVSRNAAITQAATTAARSPTEELHERRERSMSKSRRAQGGLRIAWLRLAPVEPSEDPKDHRSPRAYRRESPEAKQ